MPENTFIESFGDVTVGKDATVYTVTAGTLSGDGIDASSPTYNFLANFESIKITRSKKWSEVTPSSASEVERRRTVKDTKATLSGLVRASSFALQLVEAADYVVVAFTTVLGGSFTLRAGIAEGSMDAGADKFSDTLELIGVGVANPLS